MDTRIADWVAVIEVDDFSPLARGDVAFATELRNAIVDLSDDDFVKAIVLRSRADFAPGAEPAAIDRSSVFTTWPRELAGASALYQSITFSKKVIITEVAGECSAVGTMLVLASDVTIAAENARFSAPFRAHPEANFVLTALTIRLNRAKAWMIRDTVLDAATAHDFGLVNEVVPMMSLQAAALAAGEAVSHMPLDGIVMSKMLQQPVLDASGVGREFDMASFYATGVAR